jgi:toxin ParE1/3/4
MRLQLSPQATLDLADILDYVARDNPAAALKLVEGLEAACANLARSPGSGTVRSDLYPGSARQSLAFEIGL